MPTIRLTRSVWTFEESNQIGPSGGFGQVFRGQGDIGEVAIKRLKLTAQAAAYREMKIGAALVDRELAHVVPVLDFGQDSDSDRYFLVMPMCEHSLQDYLSAKGQLQWDEAKVASLDIIAGLREVGDIVHRDLKPGNVLWHERRWRIADFGIAKFVEDSTSLETLRTSLTPLYGAPEQWLGERATHATDIYALGCILHAVLNGRPPFEGDADDVREAHLHKSPPQLAGVDARLNGLVSTMLRKSAVSRPSLERCATIIGAIDSNSLKVRNAELAAAGSAVAQELAHAEAVARSIAANRSQRLKSAKEAISDLQSIVTRLFDEIESTAVVTSRANNTITLGPAQLIFNKPEGILRNTSEQLSEQEWDVVAFSTMNLRATLDRRSHHEPAVYSFNATFFFSRMSNDADFRWREASFWNFSFGGNRFEQQVALTPHQPEFAAAFSRVLTGWQFAHGPYAIDGENEDDFMHRWLTLFARAAQNKLRPSNYMPIPESFFK